MNREAWGLIVSGKVQGVGYRYATLRTAISLGLTGWVRNLPDGNVEIHAEGNSADLTKLETWCKQGPPSSKVSDVKVGRGRTPQDFEKFEIR